jgi:hypothetical protein
MFNVLIVHEDDIDDVEGRTFDAVVDGAGECEREPLAGGFREMPLDGSPVCGVGELESAYWISSVPGIG